MSSLFQASSQQARLVRAAPQPVAHVAGISRRCLGAQQIQATRAPWLKAASSRLAQRPKQQQLLPAPRASAPGSDNQPLAGDSPAAAVERQGERAVAYSVLSALLGLLGLGCVALPYHLTELAFLASPSAVVAGLLRLLGGAYLLAAVAANCLKEAAEHERLKSETYQRLNLGLMWWALGSLAVAWMAPVQPTPLVQGVFTAIMAFAALVPAAVYHATSSRGLNPSYLLARFLESAGGTWDLTNFSTAAYGLGALLTGFGAVAILVGKLPVLQAPRLAAPMGPLGLLLLKLSGVGMILASFVHYILKDAAARGRLGASTFKALNAGVALVCLNNLLIVASWLQGGLVQPSGLRSPVVTASAALLATALWNYFTAKK